MIGCIIPCYRGGRKTVDLVDELLQNNLIAIICIVDDQCPNRTGNIIEKNFPDNDRVKVIFNESNLGVGGATKRSLQTILKHNIEIMVKIDADGQMDPHLIPALIQPIIEGKYEASKGNRFTSIDHILSMPKIRIAGNLGLSFLNKLSTGYWELLTPQMGLLHSRCPH